MKSYLDTIIRTAQTGQIGNGKIVDSDVCNTIRIRIGESGEPAI